MIVHKIVLVIIVCTVSCLPSKAQDATILKAASELREIVLDSLLPRFQQIEKIRLRLDSVRVDDEQFFNFCKLLNRLAYNTKTNETKITKKRFFTLKSDTVYQHISDQEFGFLLNHRELLGFIRSGIFESRYPHRPIPRSIRLKEMEAFGIKKGDRVLRYRPRGGEYSDRVLYLAHDSIRMDYHGSYVRNYIDRIDSILEEVSDNPSSEWSYVLEEELKSNGEKLYDKIIYECVGVLFYTSASFFKKELKLLRKLLKDDGEFIATANSVVKTIDLPFPNTEVTDKKLKRILKRGFEVKEKLFSEGEYVVYKFSKSQD